MSFDRRFVMAALLAVMAAGFAQFTTLEAAQTATPDPLAKQFGGPFALTSHDGRKLSDTDFRGQFMLIYFGYTTCPDICPVDLAQQATALDLLGADADNIQPLFVTVDPKRDTPERITEFIASFHPRLIGLTGSETEIAAIARAYKIHRRKLLQRADAHEGHGAHDAHKSHADHARHADHSDKDSEDYLVDHGSLTFLMGPDGAFRALLPRTFAPERMAEIIAKYVRSE